MANEMKYEPTKPGKLEEHKPEEQKPESGPGCFQNFLGIFKDLFGCIKNAEEAYTNAPPQIASELPQQLQMPQQAPTQVSYACFTCLISTEADLVCFIDSQ
jgi:hypothetical protein